MILCKCDYHGHTGMCAVCLCTEPVKGHTEISGKPLTLTLPYLNKTVPRLLELSGTVSKYV